MNDTRNPRLNSNARTLRNCMTKEERHLWYDFLKGLPVVFHRQKVIGHHIVDFFCASAKLVIELDGSQHYSETSTEADLKRDEYLQSLGLVVKRCSNADIHDRFESVCEDIYHQVINATKY